MDDPVIRGLGEAANDLVTVSYSKLSPPSDSDLNYLVQWSNVSTSNAILVSLC